MIVCIVQVLTNRELIEMDDVLRRVGATSTQTRVTSPLPLKSVKSYLAWQKNHSAPHVREISVMPVCSLCYKNNVIS